MKKENRFISSPLTRGWQCGRVSSVHLITNYKFMDTKELKLFNVYSFNGHQNAQRG